MSVHATLPVYNMPKPYGSNVTNGNVHYNHVGHPPALPKAPLLAKRRTDENLGVMGFGRRNMRLPTAPAHRPPGPVPARSNIRHNKSLHPLSVKLPPDEAFNSHGNRAGIISAIPLSPTANCGPLVDLSTNCYGACVVGVNELTFKQKIGSGEFSDVFEGVWRGQRVAIKKLRAPKGGWSIATQSETLDFLKGEVLQWHNIEHKRVINLLAASLLDGWDNICLIMEMATGGSLYSLLHQKHKPLSFQCKLTMCEQMADAVACLHAKGVIHGDLKSLNCLLDDRLNLKLADFGLSRRFVPGKKLYRPPSGVGGSVRWMAPELMDGRCSEYNERADIWSLGCLFHEIMTESIPYGELIDENQLKQAIVLGGQVPTIPKGVVVNPEAVALLRWCFSRDPPKRPTAIEVLQRVQQIKAASKRQ
eukprot:Platyproteum_vivax@DN5415_c0_g1_i1.p1